jgi:hypothetical protein
MSRTITSRVVAASALVAFAVLASPRVGLAAPDAICWTILCRGNADFRVELAAFRAKCDDDFASSYAAGVVRPLTPNDSDVPACSNQIPGCQSGTEAVVWVCQGVGGSEAP